jgi:3-oxoacyl-[acyl-carrier-protein] synthase-3
VLQASDRPGFLGAATQADGAFHKHWGIYSGGTFEPATAESIAAGRTTVKMLERYPPEINHEGWPRLVRKLAAGCGFQIPDIDFILFTQVRKPSIAVVMDDLGLPLEKTHTIMEDWGYTGSACIPMAFDDARAKGLVHSGDRVVLVGSGVGYNQAAVAFLMP